jgi:hypothetical protein
MGAFTRGSGLDDSVLSLLQTRCLKHRRNAVKVLIRIVLTSLIAMAILCLPMRAQDAGGRIVGNVTDPTGAGIAGARVTVTNVASQVKYEKVSDQDGYFQVLALPIGTYATRFCRSINLYASMQDSKLAPRRNPSKFAIRPTWWKLSIQRWGLRSRVARLRTCR